MASSLPKRIAVAVVGIPAAFGIVYLGSWLLVALIALLGTVGTHELFALARARGARPYAVVGYAGAVIAPIVALLLLDRSLPALGAAGLFTAWFLAVMTAAVFTYQPETPAIYSVAVTVFAPVYASALPSALLWLRHGSQLGTMAATWLVFFPLGMVWVCDTLAMAGGSMIGGPKFAPTVSPNKTWAGTVSGVVGALLVAAVFARYVFPPGGVELSTAAVLLIGLVVGTLGQLGDLAESVFKRSAGVKDSGGFFPGHGGVLDRLDSLYWALPATGLLLAAYGVL